jgi:hypothetical protein
MTSLFQTRGAIDWLLANKFEAAEAATRMLIHNLNSAGVGARAAVIAHA